jgi:hypothetical protein
MVTAAASRLRLDSTAAYSAGLSLRDRGLLTGYEGAREVTARVPLYANRGDLLLGGVSLRLPFGNLPSLELLEGGLRGALPGYAPRPGFLRGRPLRGESRGLAESAFALVLGPGGEREQVAHDPDELVPGQRAHAFLGDVLEQLDLGAGLLELPLRLRIHGDVRGLARATRRDADGHRGMPSTTARGG